IGYFLGKNVTLGNPEMGYYGFQFHQQAGLEYIGYKDITGNGIEAYMPLMDGLFEPHIYMYEPPDTNLVNLDTVIYLRMEHYLLQFYFGVNNVSILQAIAQNSLAYRLGLFVKTEYSKIDFLIGLYAPDTLFGQIPTADSMYLNVTEHLII